MVVNTSNKKFLIIPLVFGVLFSLLYFKLPLNYFIAIFLGFAVAIVTLYDVKFGIMASIFALPYLPDMLSLIFMIFVMAAFLYNKFVKDSYNKGNVLTKHPIDVPIALYVLIIIIATITSIDPVGSFRDLAIHLVSIGFSFVIINSIKNKKDLNMVLVTIVATATLVSLFGIFQHRFGVTMEEGWIDKASNPDLIARVFSVFGNPNIMAEYLIMIIPISLALFWDTRKFTKKIFFLIITLILTIGLLLTYSRGGWVGFAFSIFFFIFLVEKRLLLLAIPLVLLSLYFLPPSIMNRIMTIGKLTDSSNFSRLKIWEVTLEIIKENWMIGVGFGYLPFKQVFDSKTTMGMQHSHNTYLEVLVELGIGGFIIFTLLIFLFYKFGIKKLSSEEDRYTKIMLAGVLSGISALLVHGLADNVLYMPRIIITFWTVMSFASVMIRTSKSR
ncbi:MAG TPA: O-antigen ligase family protein [Tissierellales bacterium]|nr:O-antigen ligase family protein [Tissierellales bacterium]